MLWAYVESFLCNARADIPYFGGGIFTGTPTYAWVWSSNAYKDAYSTDAVWSPPGGFLVQLKVSFSTCRPVKSEQRTQHSQLKVLWHLFDALAS